MALPRPGMSPASRSPVVSLFQGINPLEHALGYHMERHNVLSTNVAHVDTPGFRPMDVARTNVDNSQEFGRQLSAAMTRTSALHLPGGAANGVIRGQLIESKDAVGALDGNYVSLDAEATKVAENQLRYEVVTALTSAQFRTLSYVASDGRG
jgi:flagellar basal-body rod protein FlgB